MRNQEASRHHARQREQIGTLGSEIVPPAADDDANRHREEEFSRYLQEMGIAAEFVFKRRFVLHRMRCGGKSHKSEGAVRQELIDLEDNLAHKTNQYLRASNVAALYFLNDRQYSRALQILLAAGAAAQKGAGKWFALPHHLESAAQAIDSPDDTAAGTASAKNRTQQDSCEEKNKNAHTEEVFIAYFAERHERMRCCAVAIVENNIGLYHFKIAEYGLAEWRMSRALELEELLDVDTIGVTYFNLAQTQYELGHAEVALETITLAEEAVEKSVHESQMERNRLRRLAQQQQPQQQEAVHDEQSGGVSPPGLEQRLLQSYLRWRDGLCLLARIFEFHGDWLQMNGAYKAAMRRYEQSERWLSGLRGRSVAEMARRRKLQERIEHCRRAQRRLGCCPTPARRSVVPRATPPRAQSAIVTTTLPRSVEILDDAAVSVPKSAKPTRSPTPASERARTRYSDPLVCSLARSRCSGSPASFLSPSQRSHSRATTVSRKGKSPYETMGTRHPPVCRPPASSPAGTGAKRTGHPRHIWQRSSGEEAKAVRVLSLQRCVAVLQAFARAKIASLRAAQHRDCVSPSQLSLSRLTPSVLSSFSAALGVTSSRSVGSSSVAGPGGRLATALSFNSAVRMRHFRRYQPREVIYAFVKAAQSVQLVRRWVLCALRMLSSAPNWSHGVNATCSANTTNARVMMESSPSTKGEVFQNGTRSPGRMKQKYRSVPHAQPRSENGANMPKHVKAGIACRTATTGASAPRLRSNECINVCSKTEDDGHMKESENEPSSRAKYMTGPVVYSNVSHSPAYRYLDARGNESPEVNGREELREKDEDMSLGHSRKPCDSCPTEHAPKGTGAHGRKSEPVRGFALREMAAVVIQRAWRSRVRDSCCHSHERRSAVRTRSQKRGALYMA